MSRGFKIKEKTKNKNRLLSGEYLLNLKKPATSLNVTQVNFAVQNQKHDSAHNSVRKT